MKARNAVEKFLDLEAQVNDEEDEEGNKMGMYQILCYIVAYLKVLDGFIVSGTQEDEEDAGWLNYVACDGIPMAAQFERVADEYNACAAKEHHIVDPTSEDNYLKHWLEIDMYNYNIEALCHCELWMFWVPVSVTEGLHKFKFKSDSYLSGS